MAFLIRAFAPEMREPRFRAKPWGALGRRPTTVLAGTVLLAMFAIAVLAPWLGTADPQHVAPTHRLAPPSGAAWFGTDLLGRDLYTRVIFGARVSLLVGFVVAFVSGAAGLLLGLVACFVRSADAVVMRVMDGLMCIPSVLFAIALMALAGPSVGNVILAITITENSTRRAACAKPRAQLARATLRRGGAGVRNAPSSPHRAPHPAFHDRPGGSADELRVRDRDVA